MMQSPAQIRMKLARLKEQFSHEDVVLKARVWEDWQAVQDANRLEEQLRAMEEDR